MNVELWYDFGSPDSYFAWHRLRDVCDRHAANLQLQPMLLGGVFKATGNASPAMIEAKGKWLFADLQRHAAHYDIPFTMNPHFILNTLLAMRGAMWARETGVLEQYTQAMFEATWARQLDIANPAVIGDILGEAGLDGEAMSEAVQQPEIKQQLIQTTETAVERGVFGAPTMFVGEQMHFGQDRVDWVERLLSS